MTSRNMKQVKNIIINGKGKYFLDLLSTKIVKPKSIKETILLFGVPRGGTTWLLDILNTLNNYKPIHEPFNKNWFPIEKEMNIIGRPYINSTDPNVLLENYLKRIFSGQIPSFNPVCNYLECFSKKILVKFIRANRIIPWINNNFKVRSMNLIIRHPCAVVSSQIESGIRGYFTPKNIGLNKEIVIGDSLTIPIIKNDKELIRKLKSMKTQEEILAAIWSLDTLIPLSVPRPIPWSIIIYERMISSWEKEIKNIFKNLHEPIPKNVYEKFIVPSSTTHDASYIGTTKQLVKWKSNLSDRQIDNILKVIHWFNIDFYSLDPEPDYNKLKNWNYKD